MTNKFKNKLSKDKDIGRSSFMGAILTLTLDSNNIFCIALGAALGIGICVSGGAYVQYYGSQPIVSEEEEEVFSNIEKAISDEVISDAFDEAISDASDEAIFGEKEEWLSADKLATENIDFPDATKEERILAFIQEYVKEFMNSSTLNELHVSLSAYGKALIGKIVDLKDVLAAINKGNGNEKPKGEGGGDSMSINTNTDTNINYDYMNYTSDNMGLINIDAGGPIIYLFLMSMLCFLRYNSYYYGYGRF